MAGLQGRGGVPSHVDVRGGVNGAHPAAGAVPLVVAVPLRSPGDPWFCPSWLCLPWHLCVFCLALGPAAKVVFGHNEVPVRRVWLFLKLSHPNFISQCRPPCSCRHNWENLVLSTLHARGQVRARVCIEGGGREGGWKGGSAPISPSSCRPPPVTHSFRVRLPYASSPPIPPAKSSLLKTFL